MSKDNKQTGPKPRLRFPEFRGTNGWDLVPLGDIAEIRLGKMLDQKKHTTGKLLPYLNNLALRWNEVDTSDLPRMFFDDDELDRYGLKKGDVVVCEGGEPGRSAVWDGRLPDLKFQKAIHRVRFSIPFEPKLLVFHLEAIASTTQFQALFTGGGIKHLTRETFSRLTIPLSSEPEQQKVATCLGSLDTWIAGESQKLAALRRHKTGLMQRLFPRPGETKPRLRFPEFKKAGAWSPVEIGSLGEVVTGTTPATTMREYYGGPHSFISPADIGEGRFVRQAKSTLSDAGLAQSRAIPPQSVLFVCIGSTIGKVAQATDTCATNQQINSVVPDPSKSADFVYYALTEASPRIAALAGKQAVPLVNKTLFASFVLLAPKECEQQRIADCLASLDARLSAQSRKLDALRQHKRGLMQQLFPVADGG